MRVALVAVLLLASACTGGTHREPSVPPGEVVTKAAGTPLRFGEKPLWTGDSEGAPRHADAFTLHGESLVLFNGPADADISRLSVVDAATGRPRWSVSPGRPLPGGHGERWIGRSTFDAPQVVDRGRDWGVLVTTVQKSTARQKAYALVLLSGEDGHVLWRRPLVAENDSPAHGRYFFPTEFLTAGGLALVGMNPGLDGTAAELKLIAVDASSGKPLWTRTGLRPATLLSGSVVAIQWPSPAAVNPDDSKTGTVTVLDAATGRTRWSLLGRMPATRVAASAAGLLVVRALGNAAQPAPVVLDLTTGTELGRLSRYTLNCADDHTALIACTALYPTNQLITIRADERRTRTSGRKPPGGAISLVRDGRIYYTDANSPGREVDRSGATLVDGLPRGYLKVVSDEYAVFVTSITGAYAIYRVS